MIYTVYIYVCDIYLLCIYIYIYVCVILAYCFFFFYGNYLSFIGLDWCKCSLFMYIYIYCIVCIFVYFSVFGNPPIVPKPQIGRSLGGGTIYIYIFIGAIIVFPRWDRCILAIYHITYIYIYIMYMCVYVYIYIYIYVVSMRRTIRVLCNYTMFRPMWIKVGM